MGTFRQERDGTWNPAKPIGWQGSGLDWEIYRDEVPKRAVLFYQATEISTVTGRNMWQLKRNMRRALRAAYHFG